MKKVTFDLLKSNEINFKNLFSICVGKVFSNNIEFLNYNENYSKWDTDLEIGKLMIDVPRRS